MESDKTAGPASTPSRRYARRSITLSPSAHQMVLDEMVRRGVCYSRALDQMLLAGASVGGQPGHRIRGHLNAIILRTDNIIRRAERNLALELHEIRALRAEAEQASRALA